MKSDTIIFVAAKDSYADTWDPFFTLFFKYWPDCPYPVYMMSEVRIFAHEKVNSLAIPVDPNKSWVSQWTDRVRTALAKTEAKYLIFFHTDYFLSGKVDTARIEALQKMLELGNIGYIRLVPVPPPTKDFSGDSALGTIDKKEDYSVSFQPGIWRRDVFEEILKYGPGPIDIERDGSKNSHKLNQIFLSAKKGCSALPYVHGIGKDMWLYDAVKLLAREGFEVSNRRKETFTTYLARISGLRRIYYGIKIKLGKNALSKNFLKCARERTRTSMP